MPKKKEQEPPKDPTEAVREALEKVLMTDDIELATVVFVHKDTDEPQIWRKGHWYDAAALMNGVLHAYRAKAAMELGAS